MRRIFYLLLLSLLPFSFVSAKIGIGLKGGLNVSQVHFNSGLFENSNRMGYVVGPTLDLGLPISFLSFDVSVLYDNYTVGIQKDEQTLTDNLQFVELPVNLNLSFGNARIIKVYLSTGPQFAYNIAYSSIFDGNYSLKKTIFSWNAGVGFRFLKHFHLAYTYNIPLGNTADYDGPAESAEQMASSLRFDTHKVTLTYFF